MKRLSLALLGLPILSFAIAYKIPEQSLRSTATAASYMSNADAPDAVFFNPANMSFLREGWHFEGGLRLVYVPKVKFNGLVRVPGTTTFAPVKDKSDSDTFLVPYFYMVTPEKNNFRFGLAFTTPAGVAKEWNAPLTRAYAEKFLLKVYELSLAGSYRFSPKFSVGGGIRILYADGEVKLSYPNVYRLNLSGNSEPEFGYYISATFKPLENLTLSALYRSKVDLDIEGDADGYLTAPSGSVYRFFTTGDVSIPLPAELRLSASYKFRKATLEFTFERNFWSDYENLDFNYNDPIIESQFGRPKPKDWKDTNSYRLGFYYEFTEKWKGMLGVAYLISPIPSRTLGFELPEPKYMWVYSLGTTYRIKPGWKVGASYLYLSKGDRSVNNNDIRGKFSDISAHLITISAGFSF